MPRHQFVDAILWPSVDQARQKFGEVELRIDVVQLAGSMPDDELCRTSSPAPCGGGTICGEFIMEWLSAFGWVRQASNHRAHEFLLYRLGLSQNAGSSLRKVVGGLTHIAA